MAELDNWSCDSGLDQIIIELLSQSHQAPQMITNQYCQKSDNYEQPLNISIVILFMMVPPTIHSTHLTLVRFISLTFLGLEDLSGS